MPPDFHRKAEAFLVFQGDKIHLSTIKSEIPPGLPFPKGGEPLYMPSIKNPTFPPLKKGRCEKNDLSLFPVIPAKAGIQCFQKFANFLDPGFHRGDDLNSIFSHLQREKGGFDGSANLGSVSDIQISAKNRRGPRTPSASYFLDQTHPVGLAKPASLQAPLAGPDGKSS